MPAFYFFLHKWYQFINWKRSNATSKKKAATNFVIEFTTDTNHIVIHQHQIYRIAIDNASINCIDVEGKPVQDPDLIVELLGQIKREA